MGFWDRLVGNEDTPRPARPGIERPESTRSEDEIALERYRYLLRTAPPETIEQVHAEAFARLTDDQRRQVLIDLSAELTPAEQPHSDDPATLARAATRAETMNPGFMERTLGAQGGGRSGPGFGSMIGSSILGTVAGYVIGSALVSTFFAPSFADGGAGDTGAGDGSTDAATGGDADASAGDTGGADAGGWGDGGSADAGFGDFGGDFGF